ncbi:MAG TPA: hypothetical protein VF669_21365 [Tepidisphaeraceae bacterium]
MLAGAAMAEGPATRGTFRNLGRQITATTLQGTALTRGADGKLLACAVVRGVPAQFVVFDVAKPEPLMVMDLPEGDGSWNAATALDGSVYVGTDPKGHLFRWVPGETTVKDLGAPGPTETWIWDVTAADDGAVIVSTYPGCRLVRYHPKEGFTEISKGPLVEGENYGRSVAYDAERKIAYGGVGSHAHLVAVDLKTGKKTEFLPAEFRDQEMVYGMRFLGDRLYATVTNIQTCVIFNAKTRQFEKPLKGMPGQLVMTKHPKDERVFYVTDNVLHSYDPTRPEVGPKDLMKCADVRAYAWEGDEMVMFTRNAGVVRYDPASGRSSTLSLKCPSAPVQIQSIVKGPDGKMWLGGYLSGGNASYDPKTGESKEYRGLAQSESIAVLGKSLYFGLYPHGKFATYDTTKSWDVKANNPKSLGQIEKQSRPYGGIGVDESAKVYFGMIPEYGLLGGGLATFDPKTEKMDFQHNLVKNQSVVSLVYHEGMIAGGTSIWGGLGIQPSEKSAKLFVYDPKTREKVFETAPVEGANAVTGLTVGPDGKVWAVADGTLVIFDVASKKVVQQHELMKPDYKGKHVWRDAALVVHPNGQVYGVCQFKFFRMDSKTFEVTVLREEHTELLAMDSDGKLYMRDKANLWQYAP